MIQGVKKEFFVIALAGVFFVAAAGCAKNVKTSEQSMGVFDADSNMGTEEVFEGRATVDEEDLQDTGFQGGDSMGKGASAKLEDVYFEFNASLLRSKDKKVLDENVRWLKANPNRRITIQGHADERGTNEYNLTLGERRAQAAKRYLISNGIDPQRIKTISYGEENPFCSQHTEQCWQENRRGHFVKMN